MSTHKTILVVTSIMLTVLALLLVGGFFFVSAVARSMFPEPETRLSRYESVLAQWAPTGLVGHFPTSIDVEAENAEMNFFPGAGQGDPWFQVGFKTDPASLQEIETELKQAATAYMRQSIHEEYIDEEGNKLIRKFYCFLPEFVDSGGLPEDFILYVVHAKDRGGNWFHGEMAGAAISHERSQIIYWAESW